MKNPSAVKIFFNSFLIAVIVNSIVVSADILNFGNYDIAEVLEIVSKSLLLSSVVFACLCFVLYLCNRILQKASPEQQFWTSMTISVILTALAFINIPTGLHVYYQNKAMLVSISVFSIMVSLASQYAAYIKTVTPS